jgi:DNA-binding ferritin-like protein
MAKTRRKESKPGTRKRHSLAKDTKFSLVIYTFLGMLNTVKLYHWKTYSYAEHKATDKLYDRLNEHIDTFVEIMLGKDETRLSKINEKIKLLNYTNVKDFKARVYAYRTFLINMSEVFDEKEDSDLLNVRDEILGDINQFLYLMTFTK